MNGQVIRRLLAAICDDLDAGRAPRRLSLRRASASFVAPLVVGLASGPAACAGGFERQDEQQPATQGGAVVLDGGVDDATGSNEQGRRRGDAGVESAEVDAGAASPEDRTSDPGREPAEGQESSSERGGVPRISAEEPVVVYGAPFPRELVHRVVRRASPSLRGCLPDNADGRILLRFEISADGTVDGVDVESSSFAEEAVDECLARVISGLRFPEPRGGGTIRVRYPIVFRSDENE